MATTTIRFTTESEEGGEIERMLPAKFEVCPGCDGHGTRLCEGLRGHAFSREDFEETFDDDEDRAEYFRRGGRYDVTCTECQGRRVVAVVDREACRTASEKEALAAYDAKLEDDYEYRRLCEAERRMGC